MMKKILKTIILIAAITITAGAMAQSSEKRVKQPRQTIKLGEEMHSKRDSLNKNEASHSTSLSPKESGSWEHRFRT